MRNPVRRSSNKGSTSPSWLLKFVLLEGLSVHFLFLVCSFAFTFSWDKETYMAENNPFFLPWDWKQGQRLWTLLPCDVLNQQKLRESSSTGWSRAARSEHLYVAYQSDSFQMLWKQGINFPRPESDCLICMQHHDFLNYFFLIHSPTCQRK